MSTFLWWCMWFMWFMIGYVIGWTGIIVGGVIIRALMIRKFDHHV